MESIQWINFPGASDKFVDVFQPQKTGGLLGERVGRQYILHFHQQMADGNKLCLDVPCSVQNFLINSGTGEKYFQKWDKK